MSAVVPLPAACLKLVAAPMVKQSDLPFRILVRRHGATLAYTQMYMAHRLVGDTQYRERHLADLIKGSDAPLGRPVVVQLGGNDPDIMCAAARIVEPYCDAVDVNLGCPQQHACDGHYGGYLIQARRDWPTVESIVSKLCAALRIPVHVKMRLCSTTSMTVELAVRLARAGASVIALHARHVSARRRRHGPAELEWVTAIREALAVEGCEHTSVLSNGNVRTLADCHANLTKTGAAGVMVGGALLGNPRLFAGEDDRPWDIAVEYLELCETYADVVHLEAIKQHIKSFFSWDLRWWVGQQL
ncbi:FMN-linked oxidoreductase [Exidia glandulosa HHB12029]|uniref:tRNA-dihydrouridine synthase n=1 Tax=Exidia glandulosa HHB12029 TaxID=1314781 RepID=A0A165DQB9_EXIGL|nr:FMN-linked oxidoreductase [Exidia glandulosa HHB12029]